MFSEVFENRLVEWRSVRDSLETCNNPLQQVIEVYKKAPRIQTRIDPGSKALGWIAIN